MNAFELDIIPKPGKALLYVRLSDITNMPIADALSLLQSLGYEPQLRYLQWVTDPSKISLFALLKEETPSSSDTGERLDLSRDYRLLLEKFQPSISVCHAWCQEEQAIAA